MTYKVKKLILLMLLPLLTVSCSENSDGSMILGVKESSGWHDTASMDTKVKHFTPECKGYGYTVGTEAFYNCLERTITESARSAHEGYRNWYSRFVKVSILSLASGTKSPPNHNILLGHSSLNFFSVSEISPQHGRLFSKNDHRYVISPSNTPLRKVSLLLSQCTSEVCI